VKTLNPSDTGLDGGHRSGRLQYNQRSGIEATKFSTPVYCLIIDAISWLLRIDHWINEGLKISSESGTLPSQNWNELVKSPGSHTSVRRNNGDIAEQTTDKRVRRMVFPIGSQFIHLGSWEQKSWCIRKNMPVILFDCCHDTELYLRKNDRNRRRSLTRQFLLTAVSFMTRSQWATVYTSQPVENGSKNRRIVFENHCCPLEIFAKRETGSI
jgi:hypothetical protein